MAEAAGCDCKIVTIEKNEDMYNMALKNIKSLGYDDRIDVIYGDAMDELKHIDGSYDMIFLDAAKGHYEHFLSLCLNRLNIGGLIISDNALFRGMVASNELLIRRKITIVKRMRKYLNLISNMEELETVVMPLGDGVAMSCKIK